jgi:tartrate-resistant acid phosphatase type 5
MSPDAARRRFWIGAAILIGTCGGPTTLDLPVRESPPSNAAVDGWKPPYPAGIPDGGCSAQGSAPPMEDSADGGRPTRAVVIGDYGNAGPNEQAVSELVSSLRPDFILTTGDNNYPYGEAGTIDFNIGLFYHAYIAPYLGRFGCGADRNRFFPALGNHDWYTSGARPYMDYFTLPGNERYYDVVWGDLHVFVLDTDTAEPDGITADSFQARWLKERLASSKARWQVVTMHHPAYSSGPHGPTTGMRWPFKAWGVDLVVSGHDHIYERLEVGGLTYVVSGLGGAVFYTMGRPVDGSLVRFNESGGALLLEADATTLRGRFKTVDGRLIDEFVLTEP